MHRLIVLIRKELQELLQNRRLLPVLIIPPVVQLFVLGHATSTDVINVPMIVADGDRSASSRDLIARFDASAYFNVTGTVDTVAQVDPALSRGLVPMALSIPQGYGEDIESGRGATVQLLADGSDATFATAAVSYATSLVAEYAVELQRLRGSPSVLRAGIEPRVRVWFNPQLESRFFMVPGVLALLLLVVTANLSSMAIVRERELGTLEQLSVTPLGRWELIAGKLLPYALIGMLDALLVIAVAIGWFQVPMRGSVPLLLGFTLLYLTCTLGLGLFVSTISQTQQQAMMTTVFFFLMPMIFLSGFIFPIENMPAVVQPVTYLIPLRYYLVVVRGIFLKGVGLDVLWPQAVGLVAWAVLVLALAIVRLNKRSG